MLTREFLLANQGGLHARPATAFVQLCSTLKSDITVSLDDKNANAKSIVGIMTLGAGKGKTVTVSAAGEDEALAMEKITDFFRELEL